MQFLNISSYMTLFGNYCNSPNLFILRVCSVTAITILLLSISWLLYKIIMKNRSTRVVNTKAFNDLHTATFENNVITSYRIIQKYPVAINIPHPVDGYTPFMRSCLNGNTQLVRLMINRGADITYRTSKGETPFYLAVFYHIQNPLIKDATCIHTLFYAGADINMVNNKGYSPLHLAAMFGHIQLAQWLLNKGARIDIQPEPFVLARMQGHYETARFLERRRALPIE